MASRSVVVCLLAGVLALAGCAELMQDPVRERERFRALVKQNPDVILEALKSRDVELHDLVMDAQAHKTEVQARQRLLDDLRNPYLPDVTGRPVNGRESAKVLVVVYTDFECGPCAQAAQTVKDLLYIYPERVRYVIKHRPLESHRMGLLMAQYFEAVAAEYPDMVWTFHDALFENQLRIKEGGEKELGRVVSGLGLDARRVERRAKGQDILCRVKRDMREADAFGFTGLPTVLVNGVALPGARPVADYKLVLALIDEQGATVSRGAGRKPVQAGQPIECMETDLKN